MLRKLTVVLVVFGTLGAMAAAATADAQRVDVFGPDFEYACDFSFSGGAQLPSGSSAVLQYNSGQNSVGAVTQLRGLAPNATYEVRLIQGSGDCFTVDGTITTNSQGNGTLRVSEPSTSTQAAVFIWDTAHAGPFFESAILTHP